MICASVFNLILSVLRVSKLPYQGRARERITQSTDTTTRAANSKRPGLVPPSPAPGSVRRPPQNAPKMTGIRVPSATGLPQPSTRADMSKRVPVGDLEDTQKGSVSGKKGSVTAAGIAAAADVVKMTQSAGPSR
jgi:hypothetical protein